MGDAACPNAVSTYLHEKSTPVLLSRVLFLAAGLFLQYSQIVTMWPTASGARRTESLEGIHYDQKVPA